MLGWGEKIIPRDAPYVSLIGDDHSPFEYSLAFEGQRVELRLLLEAQGTPATPETNHAAALALNQRLVAAYGVDLGRFDLVKDLFLPDQPAPGFSLWHAVSLSEDGQAAFKIYVNPQARGRAQAFSVIEQTMLRLGFGKGSVAAIRRVMTREGVDELAYFSLDLSAGAGARAKVYVSHPRATPTELDEAFTVCATHRIGDVRDFCEAMAPQRTIFDSKPLMSCLSFVSGSDRPKAVTLHLPIVHYVDSEAQTFNRVAAWLALNGLNAEAYCNCLQAIGKRRSAGKGLQSYASYRREPSGLRFTAYLSPELFSGSSLR
jgi:DMATS type aromatic prenyltransferase